MLEWNDYRDSTAAPYALVGDLVEDLAIAEETPVHAGEGFAIYRDGDVVDWRDQGDTPWRRRGHVVLDDPASFAEYVVRYALDETVIYAHRDRGTVTAVFNDHPHSQVTDGPRPPAGHRDHTATLRLAPHPDWQEWLTWDGKLRGQREFGEFVDSMAHTVVEPDSATMLEVATTLTMKRTLDYGSRARLDNGDMEFKFVEESTMKAGRAGSNSIEIPTSFVFAAPVWEGTRPQRVTARLRVRANGDGVVMGYKLIRLPDSLIEAFAIVLDGIREQVPGHVPVFLGAH